MPDDFCFDPRFLALAALAPRASGRLVLPDFLTVRFGLPRACAFRRPAFRALAGARPEDFRFEIAGFFLLTLRLEVAFDRRDTAVFLVLGIARSTTFAYRARKTFDPTQRADLS
ncbi:MAG TPA: hypothetical protein VLK65_24800 [Vicinamibacteria bacterium]|nr:hypothetical protein [Vicinamibacteria bacterium]